MSWCRKGCGKGCKPDNPEEDIQKEVDQIWAGKSEKKVRQMVNKQRELIYQQCGPWSEEYKQLLPKPKPPKEEKVVESAPSPSNTEDKKETIKEIVKDVKSDIQSEEKKQVVKEVVSEAKKEVNQEVIKEVVKDAKDDVTKEVTEIKSEVQKAD